jgi:hypothetical protein
VELSSFFGVNMIHRTNNSGILNYTNKHYRQRRFAFAATGLSHASSLHYGTRGMHVDGAVV